MRGFGTSLERHAVDHVPALSARSCNVWDRPVVMNEFPKTEDVVLHGQAIYIDEVTCDESRDPRERYDPLRYGRMFHFITDYGYEGFMRDGESKLNTASYIPEFYTPGDVGVEDSERMENLWRQYQGITDAYMAAYRDVEERGLGNVYNKEAKLATVWAGLADALSEPDIKDTICDRITFPRGSKILVAGDQSGVPEGWTKIYPLSTMFFGEDEEEDFDEDFPDEGDDPFSGDGAFYIRTSALRPPFELVDVAYDPSSRLQHTSVYGRVRPADERAFRENLVDTAVLYLGAQYTWARKSIMGIDCSGLCSMAYMLNGVYIYRDAKVAEGFPVRPVISASEWSRDPGAALSRLRPGDLIYYPGHVVMYMGDGRIIHSTAKAGADGVVINSLRPGDIGFAEHLYGEISCAGSIFG